MHEGETEYWESPAVRKVLACSSREGDTVDGRLEERLAPEAVIARLMSGTASSIRFNNLLISAMIRLSSTSCCALFFDFEVLLRTSSSALAAAARR